MENSRKPRVRERITGLLKKPRNSEASQSPPSQTETEASKSTMEAYGDRERTLERYREATKLLEDTVKGRGKEWGVFDFPELKGEPESFDDSGFKDKIDTVLRARRDAVNDRTALGNCGHALQRAFTAFSPFAKNFLTIASQGQSIPVLNPYGLLCGGLLLFITIADKEIERKEEVGDMLDFMVQQLDRLSIVESIPEDIDSAMVTNRALDVRSACMVYLALNIRHEATPLGTFGKVVKTFVLGDQKISDSTDYLKSWVDKFTTALTDVHAHVGMNLTYPLVKETNEMVRANLKSPPPKNWKRGFSFHTNEICISRDVKNSLQTLRERLLAQVDKQYNHRIALYGMGGVGKTQCTLEYVYANESQYERIYWLSGVDQATLLSGYQKIAKRVGLPKLQNPKETAEAVLSWLRREKKWLVVIDNLDDIKVADGLLPENAPENHTIITTRNPNTIGIPAEPLEVPVFGADDAVELLLTLSRITVQPKSVEETEASNIVKTLGYLPLAIEQAASYIREVTGNLLTFSEEYSQNHRDILRRKPEDNRPYPFSIATTWAMALKVVQRDKTTTNFLRLLAYLNPDGIVIDFLIAGKDGLGEKLREIISDHSKMATAIIELEKFSLVKWDRPNRLISIHRLVQRVIRDSMSTRDQRSTSYAATHLCEQAFPDVVTENLAQCRLYQAQVVGPLLEMHSLHSKKAANVKARVGRFLYEEGQYADGEKLVLQSLEAFIKSTGKESRSTLRVTSLLTTIYSDQGRFSEALSLQKSLVTTQTKRFGTRNADTLYYMSNLASILNSLGRSTEAVSLLEEVLKTQTTLLGEEANETLETMENLNDAYLTEGRITEAVDRGTKALEVQTRVSGHESNSMLSAMHTLAHSYRSQGRFTEAADLQTKVVERDIKVRGQWHRLTLTSKFNLAVYLFMQGRLAEALQLHEEVLQKRREVLGEAHAYTVQSMEAVARLYRKLDRIVEAEALAAEIAEVKQKMSRDQLDYLVRSGWS